MVKQDREQEIQALMQAFNIPREKAEYYYAIQHEGDTGDVVQLEGGEPTDQG